VQINGKVRGEITIAPDATEAEALAAAEAEENLASRLADQPVKRVIYVPGRILNLILPQSD
jgi:leucyl-tRNA synthetase